MGEEGQGRSGRADAGGLAGGPRDDDERTEARIARRLGRLIRADQEPPAYVRRRLVEHAIAGRVLTGEVVRWEFLPWLDPVALRGATVELRDLLPADRLLFEVWRRVAHVWRHDDPDRNASALAVAAAVAGLTIGVPGRDGAWRPRWTVGGHGAGEIHRRDEFGGTVHCLDITAVDGRDKVISGWADGYLRAWDLDSGEDLGPRLGGRDRPIYALATAQLPDGVPLAVTGHPDGLVRAWDLQRWAAAAKLPWGHRGPVRAVDTVTTPEGQVLVVSGSTDATLLVSELPTLTPTGPLLTGHGNVVQAVAAFVDNGVPLALSASSDSTVRLWDLRDCRPLEPVLEHQAAVTAVQVARVGAATWVVSGTEDGALWVWDPATGRQLDALRPGHSGPVTALHVMVTPNGTVLAVTGSADRSVSLWDLRSRQRRAFFSDVHTGAITSVRARIGPAAPAEAQPSRPVIARVVCAGDGLVRQLNLDDAPGAAPAASHDRYAAVVTASDRSGRGGWAVLGGPGSPRPIRLHDGRPVGATPRPRDDIVALAAAGTAPGRPRLVSGSLDGRIDVRELPGGPVRAARLESGYRVTALAVLAGAPDHATRTGKSRHGPDLLVWGTADGAAGAGPLSGQGADVRLAVPAGERLGTSASRPASGECSPRAGALTSGARYSPISTLAWSRRRGGGCSR
jgi:hypothetical protein